ncbi:MAG TPA: radical SAM protein, partial [Bacteroidota bacterium]
FQEWLRRELPGKADKILGHIRSVRGGKLSESEFGKRMSGEGEFAETIARLFEIHAKRNGLNERRFDLSTKDFRHPSTDQLSMF